MRRENRQTCQAVFTFSHPPSLRLLQHAPKMIQALALYLTLAFSGWGIGHIVTAARRIPDMFT